MLAWAEVAAGQGSFVVLHNFNGDPGEGVIQGKDGNLFGMTVGDGINGMGTIFRMATDGSNFTILYTFTGAENGFQPQTYAGLVQGDDGTLFGMTNRGGDNDFGVIFKMAPDGSGYTILHSFTVDENGHMPAPTLIKGHDGALYGTGPYNGSNEEGMIFKMASDGSGYTVLHNFTQGPDGAWPLGKLMQANDGMFYATTISGTANNGGGIFTLAPDGSGFSVVRSLAGPFEPTGCSLVQGNDGALYGVAPAQDADLRNYWLIFKIATDGSGLTALFSDYTRIVDSRVDLIRGLDGKLYATVNFFGDSGSLFQIAPDGSGYTDLVPLSNPGRALIQGNDGVFYGTDRSGPIGVVFRVTLAGSENSDHIFSGNSGNSDYLPAAGGGRRRHQDR